MSYFCTLKLKDCSYLILDLGEKLNQLDNTKN